MIIKKNLIKFKKKATNEEYNNRQKIKYPSINNCNSIDWFDSFKYFKFKVGKYKPYFDVQ
jgi:hypothetical protein